MAFMTDFPPAAIPHSSSGQFLLNNVARSEDEVLNLYQEMAFRYFVENCNLQNGLIADTSRRHSPSSIAVVGFALSCYPIGVERGWMKRAEAASRTLAALRFFAQSLQGDKPGASGYKGFYYHFLDMDAGLREWQSELSMIDSAILAAGFLAVQTYFRGGVTEEAEIGLLADLLYRRMDWQWAQNGTLTVSQGWKPECGFLHYGWEGYSEALIMFALALGSPTYPLQPKSYEAWTATYQWENLYGQEHLYAGPLFIHQFSHAWIDFRGIQDPFMRKKRCDYFENSRRAARIQRDYAIRNPREFRGYGPNYWGLSAGEGPGNASVNIHGVKRLLSGYVARGVPYGPDDGTICPAVVFGSLPFAPEIAWPAIREICESDSRIALSGRVPNGLNPTVTGDDARGWISEGYFGLDQGLIVLMIENYRSQWFWNLMRECPYMIAGLREAGFTGGWLR
jgi:hypothetical protein